jgi:hypothetical protein
VAKLVRCDLSEEQIEATRTALLAYRMETQRYLQPHSSQPHDPCCKLEAARLQSQEDTRALLAMRLNNINGALAGIHALVMEAD